MYEILHMSRFPKPFLYYCPYKLIILKQTLSLLYKIYNKNKFYLLNSVCNECFTMCYKDIYLYYFRTTPELIDISITTWHIKNIILIPDCSEMRQQILTNSNCQGNNRCNIDWWGCTRKTCNLSTSLDNHRQERN